MAKSNVDKLIELKQLYEQGFSTKEEMETEKAKILGTAANKAESPIKEIQPVDPKEPYDSSIINDNQDHNNKVVSEIATAVVVILVAVVALSFTKHKASAEVATDNLGLSEIANKYNNTETDTVEKTEKQVVGTLKAYYAKKDIRISELLYKQGELICDSNDPIDRIVEVDDYNYKYEGDDTGEYYSFLIPKAEVTKKEYTMCHLTTNKIGNKSIFVSDEGDTVKIFRSNINRHHYLYDSGDVNFKETFNHKVCYVLSMTTWDTTFWELPLVEMHGIIDLYQWENPYAYGDGPNSCRYREGQIGIIIEEWENGEGWDNGKSAYDESGNLLVDQKPVSYMPSYISIAYIADIDALYIEGVLYYRKQ